MKLFHTSHRRIRGYETELTAYHCDSATAPLVFDLTRLWTLQCWSVNSVSTRRIWIYQANFTLLLFIFLFFSPCPPTAVEIQKNINRLCLCIKESKQVKKQCSLFPRLYVSELANTIARSVFWWKPEITTLSPEPAQGSSQAAAVKSTVAEKKHWVCSLPLSVSVSLILCEGDIPHLPTYRGDEEPVRRKLPFVETLIQMCTLLSEHHSELSRLLSLSLFSSLAPSLSQNATKLFFFFPRLPINNLPLSAAEEYVIPYDSLPFPLSLFWFSLFDLAW